MLDIIGSVMKIGALILGDKILAKWVGAAKFWFRKMADASFKAKVDAEYNASASAWEQMREERKPGPRP